MKKTLAVSLFLLSLIFYSVWNRRVQIPRSKLYVHTFFYHPRLWGNAVEFDHFWGPEICIAERGHVRCLPLKQASPK